MNHVERFLAVMNFKPFDRLPQVEWAMWWDATIARWRKEGLPASLDGVFEIAQFFGLDPYKQFWISPTVASTEAEQPGVAGTVRNTDDYLRVRQQIFPKHDFSSMAYWSRLQQQGEAVVWITLEGFFWFPRTLLGIETHMYAFYDEPELIHMMNRDVLAYNLQVLRRMVKVCRPTFMTFAEDMSYNHGPMLSRALFDEFLAPYYRQIVAELNEYGIIPIVDTDGDITAMVPWLAEVGIRGVLPLERQAGVDCASIRHAFPSLGMIGHFDKMVMHQGEDAIRKEFDRLLPTMRRGGFIPSVDHQTPPAVSLEQYHCYLQLLRQYTSMVGS